MQLKEAQKIMKEDYCGCKLCKTLTKAATIIERERCIKIVHESKWKSYSSVVDLNCDDITSAQNDGIDQIEFLINQSKE